ncbi:MAG: hypothetical protein AAGH67_03655 [Cyanobacteria bacterium P01_H01_bin.162]
MSGIHENDVQCSQILKGLNQLDEYLDEPITKDALDLDENYLTAKNKELLKRLRISLIQYIERGKDLVYIGLMGHFSTGKSSTINSLLAFEENSKERRNTGLNPVDKTITLITHSKNQDSMLNVTKEGLVPIRSSTADNEFLDNIVIADTPGTGDPVLIDKVAQDFLPICDLIIYFFSATNPLDAADKPFLEEKFSELHFIPIKFVVTRADEFRINSDIQLSSENFDSGKSNAFLGALSERINSLFKYQNVGITAEDIFLIDNKAQFEIHALKSFISEFSDANNVSGQVRIHSHKVRYYQGSADSLKVFFANFIDDKVISLSNFVISANENIDRFNDAIQISNNSLTQSWTTNFEEIQKIRNRLINNLPESILWPSKIFNLNFQERHITQSKIQANIKTESRERIKSWIKLGKKEVLQILQARLSSLKDAINTTTVHRLIEERDLLRLEEPNISLKKFFEEKVASRGPETLASDAINVFRDVNRALIDKRDTLDKNIQSLKQNLEAKRPLHDYREIILDAEDVLSKDFDRFFDIITIYRSGVFSYNVRETIEKLGLGRSLDKLESKKLSDIQKDLKKQEANGSIFPDKNQLFSDFSQETAELEASCIQLKRDFNELRKNDFGALTPTSIEWSASEIESVIVDLASEVESKITLFQQNINSNLASNIVSALEKWREGFAVAKRERFLYFLSVIVSTALLSLTGYFLFIYVRNIDVGNNASSVILWGILTSIIFEAISLFIANHYDRFPKRIRFTEDDILKEFRAQSLR